MGLSSSAVNRFRNRVDATLADLFPCVLIIDAVEIPASGPGGRLVDTFMEAGQDPEFRFSFRIARADLATAPRTGQRIGWKLSESSTLALEVVEAPVRPHEAYWSITTRHRRRA